MEGRIIYSGEMSLNLGILNIDTSSWKQGVYVIAVTGIYGQNLKQEKLIKI